jgi:anti-sigma factor RsiW
MTRLRCRFYQAWLVDFADGVLDPSRQQRLEQHLTLCPACRADLEALRDLPDTLQTSTVPDPGDAFWLQQRQEIARVVRNLPQPRARWQLTWLHEALQLSPWRYAVAATLGLLLAVSVYRIAERPPQSDRTATAAQLAVLDSDALLALQDLMAAVTPSDHSLSNDSQEDQVAFAALAAGDLVGTTTTVHPPDETELSDTDLDGVDELIGDVG